MKTIFQTIFLALFTTICFGQSGIFKGTVYDKNTKKSVPEASIIIYRQDTIVSKTIADSDGKFKIEKIYNGKYTAISQAIGYKEGIITGLIISSNKTTYFDFQLKTLKQDSIDKKSKNMYFLVGDSLGNRWCIDGSTNQVDSLGRKQGLWKKYFMDYSDKKSGFQIGQLIWEGNYKDDNKDGEWTFYKSNTDIERIEFYKAGKLIETKK